MEDTFVANKNYLCWENVFFLNKKSNLYQECINIGKVLKGLNE